MLSSSESSRRLRKIFTLMVLLERYGGAIEHSARGRVPVGSERAGGATCVSERVFSGREEEEQTAGNGAASSLPPTACRRHKQGHVSMRVRVWN
jgi:hypothetical protein